MYLESLNEEYLRTRICILERQLNTVDIDPNWEDNIRGKIQEAKERLIELQQEVATEAQSIEPEELIRRMYYELDTQIKNSKTRDIARVFLANKHGIKV